MSPARPRRSVAERLAAAAQTALIGRANERARLASFLVPTGPAAVFVHGPGGIGKTALVSGTLASLSLKTITLDGRQVEPTVSGALAAIGAALGVPSPSSASEAARAMAPADVLVVDSFERLNLLDGWIRNELAAALPSSVTVVLVGRRGPNVAWRTAPGWRTLLAELVVGPMTGDDIRLLLAAHGVRGPDARRIQAFARGHPLAAVVAAEALARSPGLSLGSGAPAEVVEELFAVILDDLSPQDRAAVEAVSVLRRVTVPLLAAVVEQQDVESAWQALRRLPFTTTTAAGLELSGIAGPVVLEALELRDPVRARWLRTRAAQAILASLAVGSDWQSTADLLHLVQNPLIRNAYSPPGTVQRPVEQARVEDRDDVVAIAERFTGEASARLVERWWQTRRETFAVVRGGDGEVAGFSVTGSIDDLNDATGDDPAMRAVGAHLRLHPMPPDARALVFRWALGSRHGEQPTPELAALVIDLKRSYLELRARLRRVYTVVADWALASPVLQVMGFSPVDTIDVGDRRFVVALLDFGPGGVDAWICRHVLAEQSVQKSDSPVPEPRRGTPATPSVLTTLTAREQEVLALLAEGRTNAQLAKDLFISERTANRHVSNIFVKLGVHNRTQAARVATATGFSG